jgi:carbon storage regulator
MWLTANSRSRPWLWQVNSERRGFPTIKEECVMLVLSRKCGEAIVIADNITVTVLEVRGSRVKLGFVAPDDATIHRAEVYENIEHCLPAGCYAEAALA